MRLLRWTLMIVVAFFGVLPALFIAAPGAHAACSLLGDGYSDDLFVIAYECDSFEECTEWLHEVNANLDIDGEAEISCSVADAPLKEDSPLGEPPTLIPRPPAQVEELKPACYGDSCKGLNPSGTRCEADAYTIYSEEVVINSDWSSIEGAGPWGIAEMRYSPTCRANWVRYTPYTNIDDVIRFIIDAGAQKANDGDGFGTYYGVPYIWRLGVKDTLQGPIDSSDPFSLQVTNWTAMVSAEGATCWSVEIHWRENHHAGGGERDHLGTFDADCVT